MKFRVRALRTCRFSNLHTLLYRLSLGARRAAQIMLQVTSPCIFVPVETYFVLAPREGLHMCVPKTHVRLPLQVAAACLAVLTANSADEGYAAAGGCCMLSHVNGKLRGRGPDVTSRPNGDVQAYRKPGRSLRMTSLLSVSQRHFPSLETFATISTCPSRVCTGFLFVPRPISSHLLAHVLAYGFLFLSCPFSSALFSLRCFFCHWFGFVSCPFLPICTRLFPPDMFPVPRLPIAHASTLANTRVSRTTSPTCNMYRKGATRPRPRQMDGPTERGSKRHT